MRALGYRLSRSSPQWAAQDSDRDIWEAMMDLFEIRVLSTGGLLSLLTQQTFMGANAAIGAAQRIANGKPFEVWNGERCVFTSPDSSAGRTMPRHRPPPDPRSRSMG
jgi:hypothetical protein